VKNYALLRVFSPFLCLGVAAFLESTQAEISGLEFDAFRKRLIWLGGNMKARWDFEGEELASESIFQYERSQPERDIVHLPSIFYLNIIMLMLMNTLVLANSKSELPALGSDR
jgi:hypothetical protein